MMIAGLSKAIILYLAPLLTLTAILLSIFAFLSPVVMLHDRVALLTVTPLIQPGSSVDGPSIFLGVLGSCSRVNNAAPVICTRPAISSVYDLSVLPDNASHLVLSAPTASAAAFIAVALAFSTLFFITFTLISFREKMGERLSNALNRPFLQSLSAWIGFFGFLIGLTSFLILRMWFGKAIQDFNSNIAMLGGQGPKLVAQTGNAFTMIWVAYAFYTVPIIISLAKLNVKPTKG
ncbi:hypothetical protein L208DRAFT_1450548 [Tricholoma matsutake]|nr:hypothetical protein L208DRAFT_1450548 [Tricholoma matsutake 945]